MFSKKMLGFAIMALLNSSYYPNMNADFDIKCDNSPMADENRNTLEQFMDAITQHEISPYVETPNRDVPVYQISYNNKKELTGFSFSIPYRIDMDSKYSEQINQAVENRNELIFAAFRHARNAIKDEDTGKLFRLTRDNTLYNLHKVPAGKYGYMLCLSPDQGNTSGVSCMTKADFLDYLAWSSRRAKRDHEDDLENIKQATDFAESPATN